MFLFQFFVIVEAFFRKTLKNYVFELIDIDFLLKQTFEVLYL